MAKRDRIFAGFGAALFLVTSSIIAVAAIIALTQSSSSSSSASTAANSSSSNNSNSSSPNSQPPKVGSKLKGFTPLTKPLSKLEVANLQVGKGATVKAGDTITANYIGAIANTGVIFDTSTSHGGPQTFSLSQVIAGWQEGIPGMKVGGTRELLIPASLAYGSKGSGAIPPNSDLVFLVTVLNVKP